VSIYTFARSQVSPLAHYERDFQHEFSVAWQDFENDWIEQRVQNILDERELSELIGDYCDKKYVSPVTGQRLNRWVEYDNVMRATMKSCPVLRDFMERAAVMARAIS